MPVPKPRHLSSPRLTTHESGVLLREALGEQLRPRVDGGRSRAGARGEGGEGGEGPSEHTAVL